MAGDASSRETFVTGDAVNVAARLEQAARPGEVLLGEPTLRLVREAVRAEAVEPLAREGKSEPVPAYRLLEVDGPRAGAAAGRNAVRRARGRARAARAGVRDGRSQRECRLVTVVGEPGVGKSRLAAEFVARVGARARVVRGGCLSYGEGITFWAVGQIVRELAGIRDEHSPAEARALIEARVEGAAERARSWRRRSRSCSGSPRALATAEETAAAIGDFLAAGAASQPLVVLVDDIHWAEPTLLDLLAGLPAAIGERRRSCCSAWRGPSCSSTGPTGR